MDEDQNDDEDDGDDDDVDDGDDDDDVDDYDDDDDDDDNADDTIPYRCTKSHILDFVHMGFSATAVMVMMMMTGMLT